MVVSAPVKHPLFSPPPLVPITFLSSTYSPPHPVFFMKHMVTTILRPRLHSSSPLPSPVLDLISRRLFSPDAYITLIEFLHLRLLLVFTSLPVCLVEFYLFIFFAAFQSASHPDEKQTPGRQSDSQSQQQHPSTHVSTLCSSRPGPRCFNFLSHSPLYQVEYGQKEKESSSNTPPPPASAASLPCSTLGQLRGGPVVFAQV